MIAEGIGRFIRWVIDKFGLRVVISLCLLWLALGSLVTGLSSVIPAISLAQGLMVCLVGTLLAWRLARSQRSTIQSGLLLVLVGGLWFILQGGNLGTSTADLLRSLILSIRQGDLHPVQLALAELWASSAAWMAHLWVWGAHMTSADQPFDPIVVRLIWSGSLWLIAIWAAWSTRRWHQPLLALAPAGAILAAITNYTSTNALLLVPFLGASLLLMSQTSHARRESDWQAAGIDFSEDIRPDLGIWAFTAAAVIILLAASTPSVSIHQLTGWIRDKVGLEGSPVEPLARSLGIKQQSPGESPWGAVATGSMPRSFLLGAGPELTQRVVMRVRTGELPPGPVNSALAPPAPYYWRAATLDYYTGFGWATTLTDQQAYSAGKAALSNNQLLSRQVHQDVEILDSSSGQSVPLYTAGDLISADQAYWIDWRHKPEQGASADYFGAWLKTSSYKAESLVSTASIADLRGASQAYPEWISSHYLELPTVLPDRIRQLAKDLTAGQPTPYDRAKAIETYLRQFPYSLDVPAPPAGREVSEYFLFELKRGYCDYYATSMVVLARAVGIPARFAMGYASGTYDDNRAEYVIRGADAHSWPEVYFPGYGWINFEPTASQPDINRSLQNSPSPTEVTSAVGGQIQTWPGASSTRVFLWVGTALLLALTGVIVSLAIDRFRYRQLAPRLAIQTIFERMKKDSQKISRHRQPGDTPFELARRLGDDLRDLQGRAGWGKALRGGELESAALSEIYATAAYSPHPTSQNDKGQAIQKWRRLRWRLRLARLILRINALPQMLRKQ